MRNLTAMPRGAARDIRTGTRGVEKRASDFAARIAVMVIVFSAVGLAQGEPEAPREIVKPFNGYQIAFFTGLSYNVFSGSYDGNCSCEFLSNETSFNAPVGLSVNIPVFADASIYLRGSWQATRTEFFTGRTDSLRSLPGTTGDIGTDMELTYSMVQFDLLVRLIGKQDGERVFFGPSLGLVRQKRVRITDTEYETGTVYTVADGDYPSADAVRRSFVIGAEYAFIPLPGLYVIPSLQIDYALEKISDIQPLRPNFYKILVTVAYQLF